MKLKKTKKMKVFDKEFDVEFISIDDKSIKGKPDRTVLFMADGEVYRYVYTGNEMMVLSYVTKENKETGERELIYTPWKNIPGGHYYVEIGRKLSMEHQDQS